MQKASIEQGRGCALGLLRTERGVWTVVRSGRCGVDICVTPEGWHNLDLRFEQDGSGCCGKTLL